MSDDDRRVLEQALGQAVRASVALPAAERAGFISSHLMAQHTNAAELPVAGAASAPPTGVERKHRAAELAELAGLLTAVVNSAQKKTGWPLAAVATALAERAASAASPAAASSADPNADGPGAVQAAEGAAPLAAAAPASVDPETELMQKRRQESAEKRAALADALVIANEVKAIATAAGPLTALRVTREHESRWGDREIALMAKSLERPAFDEELLALLQARQWLAEPDAAAPGGGASNAANAAAAVGDPSALDALPRARIKELDRALKVLGVTVDAFGMWREEEEDAIESRLGVAGACLLVDTPAAVTELTLGAYELRGATYMEDEARGRGLGPLLGMLPKLERLSLSMCKFLHTLPDEIGSLAHLAHLDLSGCTRLPRLCSDASFGKLGGLRTLDLSDCENLSALPSTIPSLAELRCLLVSQGWREVDDAAADGGGKEGGGAKDADKRKKSRAARASKEGPNRRRTATVAAESAGIVALPDGFGRLASLRHLALGLAMLPSLPDAVGELTSLRTLSLSGSNALAALPASLGNLKALEYLELPECPATVTLPDGIWAGMESLATLDLYQCANLTALPKGLAARAPTLHTLYIGSLELAELPDELCALTKLAHLELTTPSLAALPPGLGRMASLQSLHVTHAALVALPDGLGDLQALTTIKLSRCATLAALPEAIGQCAALQYVGVSECPALTKLPASFGALAGASLMALDFPGCDDLADVLYDDPVVDVLEGAGCGVFGPGIEIETRKYVDVKERLAADDEERKGRLAALRAVLD